MYSPVSAGLMALEDILATTNIGLSSACAPEYATAVGDKTATWLLRVR